METIEQDPNDEVLKQPIKKNNQSLIWMILTGVFALGMIIFAIIAFTSGGSDTKCASSDGKKSEGSSTGTGSETKEEDSLALKNFDLNIGKLVGAAGFNYGSILSVKTNADGTYMIGEIKNGNTVRFTRRALPNGSWERSNLVSDAAEVGGANNTCVNIEKWEIELFSNYKTSNGNSAYCVVYNNIDELGPDDDTEESVLKTAAEALKEGFYKPAE